MRTETEWMETVETGWNVVVGADKKKIVEAVRSFTIDKSRPELYGDGNASKNIVHHLRARELNSLRANGLKINGFL
jgi:UDP-N-acetylglucosamine 2-epimerase